MAAGLFLSAFALPSIAQNAADEAPAMDAAPPGMDGEAGPAGLDDGLPPADDAPLLADDMAGELDPPPDPMDVAPEDLAIPPDGLGDPADPLADIAGLTVEDMTARLLSSGFDPVERGRLEYERTCAACHGLSGTGDGPISGMMAVPVPDLTRITEQAGEFPMSLIYEIIDGRERLAAHGGRTMPVWGNRFGVEAALEIDPFAEEPTLQAMIAARIMSLVFYLHSIQVQAPEAE
ncbi:MAG: c-type cytochrome [Pseudomonadota bacterium]